MKQLVRDLQFLAYFTAAVTCLGCSSAIEYEVSQANPLDGEESDVVARINQLRTSAGLPTVSVCVALNVATSAHSDDMRDKNYLSDKAPDGSTTPTRACEAGYTQGCNNVAGMVELIAKGHAEGKLTFDQWNSDPSTSVMFTKPEWVVIGVGRSLNEDVAIWTVNLADKADPGCEGM